MIDFEPDEREREVLEQLRREALVARRYARHYDEHEDELPPDELPEAAGFPPLEAVLAKHGLAPPPPTLLMLLAAGLTWGDYAVRVRRRPGALGNTALEAAGTPEQIETWRRLLLAMAITEPGCGSDPSMISTRAELDGDSWVLNGEKIFVTSGIRCEGVVVWATVDPRAGRAGIKSFLIEKGTPGLVVSHKEKKLGIRGDDTATLVLQDCRVPRENLLGLDPKIPTGTSGGFRGVLKTFNLTRPAVAASGLGMAEAALDFTREQLREAGVEVDYGAAAASRSATAEKLLRLEAKWEAAMLTVLRAAWLAGEEKPNNLEASIAKAKAGRAVREITQGCIEILGPMGVSREHLLEKWLRDVRITDIYEGTGQIQQMIIARKLLGYSRKELS